MNKGEIKALLRAREEAAIIAAEKARERRIGEDVMWRGVGLLALQLRELPSFESGHIWDVRTVDGALKLYVSRTNPEKPGYLLPGYSELACDAARLKAFVEQLELTQVATPLLFKGSSWLDGTSYSLVRSDGFDSVTFRWWEKGPAEWEALTSNVMGFIGYLKQQNPSA
ncbi:hypothetical protein [Corallococcus terminator]|uniref:Uncharacterized protein n=1 Tax=Corallococcus terminator TaxID=2316733 RepID=A0A3A8HQ09_9BACT|nr:hypothetical protein [Corallococcus terminator]RKG73432.1 hypothetical protein D7V88_36425 [Corallococcus terminator]